MAPWSAYQKYGDPPGNRLVKWLLGGVVDIDDRGIGETTRRLLPPGRHRRHAPQQGAELRRDLRRRADGRTPRRGGWGARRWRPRPLRRRSASSSSSTCCLRSGLFLLGPLAMAGRPPPRPPRATEWSFALNCFAVFAIGVLAWVLLHVRQRSGAHASSTRAATCCRCSASPAAAVGLRAAVPALRDLLARRLRGALAGALRARAFSRRRQRPFLAGRGALPPRSALAGFCLVAWRRDEPSPGAPADPLSVRNRLARLMARRDEARPFGCSPARSSWRRRSLVVTQWGSPTSRTPSPSCSTARTPRPTPSCPPQRAHRRAAGGDHQGAAGGLRDDLQHARTGRDGPDSLCRRRSFSSSGPPPGRPLAGAGRRRRCSSSSARPGR